MSHRKVYSQGNIPFSWEDSPGISKFIRQDLSPDKRLHALNLSSSPPPSPMRFPGVWDSSFAKVSAQDTKNIPLPPPCQKLQPPRRSISSKGLGWQDDHDPFLAAYKECTKNKRNNGELPNENNKKNIIGNKVIRKSKLLIFSCKKSCDIKDDSLVRLSNLPPIPRNRVKADGAFRY